MIIYTIGFTKKSAQDFFEKIRQENIEVLIDTRLNNKSQLAGFTKERDLPYFLEKLSNCKYSYQIKYAPYKEMLQDYKKGRIAWDEYDIKYRRILETRKVISHFQEIYGKYDKVVLLCSECTPEYCHRRILAEELSKKYGYEIVHL